MQVTPNAHLTYCLNVHPGESWAENMQAIRTHTLAVRRRVSPDAPFGLGLRVSAQAARELSAPGVRDAFRAFLNEHGLYVFTINGFPYGRFHGGHIKERVYVPDWTTEARRNYTNLLADHLSALMPDGMDGSISTVPVGYKSMIHKDTAPREAACLLADCVAHLAEIDRRTGREIHIGLEPEPACFIETTDECIAFFNDAVLKDGIAHLISRLHVPGRTAETLIRRHLGVCLDTCHAALQFEDPATAMARYRAEGIRLSKIQISAALETDNTEPARRALRAYDEPVYLHQTRARDLEGRLLAWNDLPDALNVLSHHPMADTVRVHFHVPLFWAGEPPLRSTHHTLDEAFWKALRSGICPHLEIETYTFDVLPPGLRASNVTESITRECQWVQARMED